MLSRPPDRISLAEVVVALEGPLAPVTCVQDSVVHDCAFGDTCAMREVWQRVTDVTRQVLEETRSIEAAARRLGFTSLDATATLVGHRWDEES